MWSLIFGLLSLFAVIGFYLTIRYKEKIDDGEIVGGLIIITVLSFIFFTIMSGVTYKTDEDLYGRCMQNVNDKEYCIKYLKE